jgi:hypothetical protein
LSNISGKGIFWVECLGIDIFEAFPFYVDGFGVSSEALKRKVNVIVILIDYLYMC